MNFIIVMSDDHGIRINNNNMCHLGHFKVKFLFKEWNEKDWGKYLGL